MTFSIDKTRLRAVAAASEAASATVKAAHSSYRDAADERHNKARALEHARAARAARPRYLSPDQEEAQAEAHAEAIAKAEAALREAEEAFAAAEEAYRNRTHASNEALKLAKACEEYAASKGVTV